MLEKIDQIRGLLSELEGDASQVERAADFRALSGLELPDIIADVVDLLMPELTPYAFAFYIYLLRHSVVGSGNPYVRAGRKKLQRGIMKSNSGQGDDLSYQTVQRSFGALVAAGAIREEGEPNRDGTLYRVLLPEEIPACQRRRAETAKLSIKAATEHEADFYNVRENRLKIYERDSYHCTYCGKQLTRFTATLDHITPVSEGGDNSAENLKTACLQCNSRKTARPLGDFLVARDSV
jgi:hypothetical protein